MLEQNLWPRRSSFSWGLLASSFGGRHSAMAGATRSLINIESTKRVSHQAQPLGGRKPGAEEWAPSEAMRIIAAAALYFLIVYCVGFLLGALRVFWLEPRLGETVAVLCEAPFVLIASVLAARWLPTILSLRITTASLLAMGIGALCLQQLADFALGALLRGITPTQQIAHFATAPGMVYFTLLVVFAAMPILANWPSLPSRRSTLT